MIFKPLEIYIYIWIYMHSLWPSGWCCGECGISHFHFILMFFISSPQFPPPFRDSTCRQHLEVKLFIPASLEVFDGTVTVVYFICTMPPPPKKTTKKPHTVPEYDQNNQEGSLICASQSFQSAVLPLSHLILCPPCLVFSVDDEGQIGVVAALGLFKDTGVHSTWLSLKLCLFFCFWGFFVLVFCSD